MTMMSGQARERTGRKNRIDRLVRCVKCPTVEERNNGHFFVSTFLFCVNVFLIDFLCIIYFASNLVVLTKEVAYGSCESVPRITAYWMMIPNRAPLHGASGIERATAQRVGR